MRTTLALLLMLIGFSVYAQPGYHNRNCRTALPDNMFRQRHKAILAARSENQRAELAKILALDECLNSAQVKSVADILKNDFHKLDFAKNAYRNTIDKENFYDVFDSFSHFSTAFLLYDFIQELRATNYPIDYLPPSQHDNKNDNGGYPPYGGNYPNNDPGQGPCRIHQKELSNMLETIRNESFDKTKLTLTKNILQSNPCFRTEQVKEIIELFSFEDSKLEISKFAYDYTVDKGNYYIIADSFSFSSSKDQLMKFLQSKN